MTIVPLSARAPPLAGWLSIVPALVIVLAPVASVALLPQPSSFVRTIVPALVRLADAVVTACSLQVLAMRNVWPELRLPPSDEF